MSLPSNSGRVCPGCGREIVPGDQAVMCPTCGTVQHSACWKQFGGCTAEGCPTGVRKSEPAPAPTPAVQSAPASAAPAQNPCPVCGAPVPAGSKFCNHCGATAASVRTCPGCGAQLAEDQPFCPTCGGRAQTSVPMTPPPPPPGYTAAFTPVPPAKKKSKTGLIIGIAAVAVVAVLVLVIVLMGGGLKEVELSQSSLSLEAGDVYTLEYDTDPKDYDAEDVEWSTSDSGVATVRDGEVTAVGAGTCEITLEVDGKKDTCEVEVTIRPEESYVVGYWDLDCIYDSEEDDFVEAQSWGWSITLYSDMTGKIVVDDETDTFTWYYTETDDEGDYWYVIEFEEGGSMDLTYWNDLEYLVLYVEDSGWLFVR